MKLPLSNRLLACCSFVRPGDRVADIGCDHGYLGIYLLKNGIASEVIAADVNKSPLQNAVIHARKFGVQEHIRFYLSDGVRNIPREFDSMVCAGMGADTMISILSSAPWLKDSRYRLILQCQSKRPELRRFLAEEGYRITRETLAQDGKFIYPITEVTYAPSEDAPREADLYLSPALLASSSPLLPAFCSRMIGGVKQTVQGLQRTGGEKYETYSALLEQLRALVPEGAKTE